MIASLDPDEGGPPVVATRLAAAQAALDHDVHVISLDAPLAQHRIDAVLADCPNGEDVTLHLGQERASSVRASLPQAVQTKLAALRPMDFIHIHGVWEPMLLWTSRYATRHAIPYAIAPHGMLDPWSLQQSRWKKRVALAVAWRSMLDHAVFLHVLNADEGSGIARLGLRAPLAVIPNGVFPEEFEDLPTRGAFRHSHPQVSHHPYILFLGRLHYKKGLDVLAALFAEVASRQADVHLVVAGPDGGARGDFIRRVARLGLHDRVHLVGALYGRAKLAAFVDSTCFVLPSRQEGFSVAITEAMACSVPVVITENCHYPEVVEANAGRVVALDSEALASAVTEILEDPRAAQTMGRAGRRLVLNRFTWPKIARITEDAYNRHRPGQ